MSVDLFLYRKKQKKIQIITHHDLFPALKMLDRVDECGLISMQKKTKKVKIITHHDLFPALKMLVRVDECGLISIQRPQHATPRRRKGG